MDGPPMDLWEPPVDTYAPVAQVSPSAQNPPRREAPTTKPVAQAPAFKPTSTPKAAPAPAAPAAGTASKRVLRPIKTWTEAVDRVRDTSRMAASFLVSAKAYTTEEGRVIIKLESDFIRSMSPHLLRYIAIIYADCAESLSYITTSLPPVSFSTDTDTPFPKEVGPSTRIISTFSMKVPRPMV